jgi:hypothetical protein
VSSSSVRKRMSSTTDAADATSAAMKAANHESTEISSGAISEASMNIAASTTSTSRNPSTSVSGRRIAATIGGRTALKMAIRSAAISAPPKPLISRPGNAQAAKSSAPADRIQATSSRTGWSLGRSSGGDD